MKSAFYNITKIYVNSTFKEAVKDLVLNFMYNEDENYFNDYMKIIKNFELDDVERGSDFDNLFNENRELIINSVNDIYDYIDKAYDLCLNNRKMFLITFKFKDYFYFQMYWTSSFSNKGIYFTNGTQVYTDPEITFQFLHVVDNNRKILYYPGNTTSTWQGIPYSSVSYSSSNNQFINNNSYYINYFKIVCSNNIHLMLIGRDINNLFAFLCAVDNNGYHYIRQINSNSQTKNNVFNYRDLYCYENNMKSFKLRNYFDYKYNEIEKKMDYINYGIINSTDFSLKYESKIPNIINHTYMNIYDTIYYLNGDKYITLDSNYSVLVEREGES